MEDGKIIKTKSKSIIRQPKREILAGQRAAKILIDVVTQNKWSINIGNKKYLQFEAWQTLARFYRLTLKTEWTKYVEYGTAKGFEARVIVLDDEGKEIGGAEAVCLDNENNWRGKPLFSLKAMAQTRAGGRALRQILSWVAVLAGYEPSPAEEMDGIRPNRSRFTSRFRPQQIKTEKPIQDATPEQEPLPGQNTSIPEGFEEKKKQALIVLLTNLMKAGKIPLTEIPLEKMSVEELEVIRNNYRKSIGK